MVPEHSESAIDSGFKLPTASELGKSDIIPIVFDDKQELYRCYMPYVKHGALFVKTMIPFELGEEVFILVGLPSETKKHSVAGKVVWATPRCAQGGKVPGIGVQLLGETGKILHDKIEAMVAALLKSDQATDSM